MASEPKDWSSVEPPSRGRRRTVLRLVRNYPLAFAGAVVLALIVSVGLAAPWIAPYDPREMSALDRLLPPSSEHWFGTDEYGRDIVSRAIYGSRISVLIAISVAAASSIVGFAIGALAGYFREADLVLMRVMDGLMAIPGILLA